jgi:hypothetical protein
MDGSQKLRKKIQILELIRKTKEKRLKRQINDYSKVNKSESFINKFCSDNYFRGTHYHDTRTKNITGRKNTAKKLSKENTENSSQPNACRLARGGSLLFVDYSFGFIYCFSAKIF